jgi:hypothetical protein
MGHTNAFKDLTTNNFPPIKKGIDLDNLPCPIFFKDGELQHQTLTEWHCSIDCRCPRFYLTTKANSANFPKSFLKDDSWLSALPN